MDMELKFNDMDKITNENCCKRAIRNIMSVTQFPYDEGDIMDNELELMKAIQLIEALEERTVVVTIDYDQ